MSQEVIYVMPKDKSSAKKYCCVLLNELLKGMQVIDQEFHRLQMLENEYNNKLQIYLEVSRRVDKKLCNLWDISSQIVHNDYTKSMEIYTFANGIIKTWQDGNTAIAKDTQNVLLISYTNPNAPLKVVVEKIIANSNISKDAYQKIIPHIFCMGRFNSTYTKALPLFERLRNGNMILQYFLSICRGIPHLNNLENTVDQYISSLPPSLLSQVYQNANRAASVSISSGAESSVSQSTTAGGELFAYNRVVQLLNGELLAEENFLHHHSRIAPLVSHEYILPDTIPEAVKVSEAGGVVRSNAPNIKNPVSVIRNEFPSNGTKLLIKASQDLKTGTTILGNDGQRCVEVLVMERPANTKLLAVETAGSSSTFSSSSSLMPKLLVQDNDTKKVLNRRRQLRANFDVSDLKPIKIPKLKMDLLTPLP